MARKTLPFSLEEVKRLAEAHPTPFYIYDEEGIRETAKAIKKAFSSLPNFRNFFAVKALPNPHILEILKQEGMGADCSSLPELILAERVGLRGKEIMFTSNDTPKEEFIKAEQLGAYINLDDLTHLDFLEETLGKLPNTLCFRYNPGPSREGNEIIGKPEEAKFGLTREQIFEAYRRAKEKGVETFGLHTMVASNVLDPNYFKETAKMMFSLAAELIDSLDLSLEFINLGGGIGIPYKPEDPELDFEAIADGIAEEYNKFAENYSVKAIFMENGRAVTGPHGYLITRVRHVMRKYKNFVGVDATMANLMRPALYGAYHHITVMGRETAPPTYVCDVVGSLCENNDKFAINRKLPKPERGDFLAIHDAGAHGHAMGFNYNGKLRSAEFLLTPEREFKMIRRAETIEDYFATLV